MDIATLKDYFDLGLITSVLVRAPSLLHSGWTIEVSGNIGNADPVLRTARKTVKEFKLLDSAAKELAAAGVKRFAVIQD